MIIFLSHPHANHLYMNEYPWPMIYVNVFSAIPLSRTITSNSALLGKAQEEHRQQFRKLRRYLAYFQARTKTPKTLRIPKLRGLFEHSQIATSINLIYRWFQSKHGSTIHGDGSSCCTYGQQRDIAQQRFKVPPYRHIKILKFAFWKIIGKTCMNTLNVRSQFFYVLPVGPRWIQFWANVSRISWNVPMSWTARDDPSRKCLCCSCSPNPCSGNCASHASKDVWDAGIKIGRFCYKHLVFSKHNIIVICPLPLKINMTLTCLWRLWLKVLTDVI